MACVGRLDGGGGRQSALTKAEARTVTPLQEERLWRRLLFKRDHQRNLLAWAKTDLERDRLAEEVRRLTWELIDLDADRRAVQRAYESEVRARAQRIERRKRLSELA